MSFAFFLCQYRAKFVDKQRSGGIWVLRVSNQDLWTGGAAVQDGIVYRRFHRQVARSAREAGRRTPSALRRVLEAVRMSRFPGCLKGGRCCHRRCCFQESRVSKWGGLEACKAGGMVPHRPGVSVVMRTLTRFPAGRTRLAGSAGTVPVSWLIWRFNLMSRAPVRTHLSSLYWQHG